MQGYKDFVPHDFGPPIFKEDFRKRRKYGPVWFDVQISRDTLAYDLIEGARGRWSRVKIDLLQDDERTHLAMRVLMRILDLHKPIRFSYDEDILCTSCDSVWPCQTFMEIEDANARAQNSLYGHNVDHDHAVDPTFRDDGSVYGMDPFPDH